MPHQQSQSGGSGVGDAFQYGWTKFQQNLGQIIVAILAWVAAVVVGAILYFLLNAAVIGILGDSTAGVVGFMVTSAVGALVFMAAYLIGSAAIIRVGLLVTKGEELTPQRLFSTDNLVPFILTSLLVAVITSVASLVTCGLLGIVAGFFLLFAPYYSLDRGTGPMEAIRASVTLVNRNIATIVVLYIGALIATAIGAALCLIGLLVAAPVVLIAYGYMYRQLNGEMIAP